MKKENFFPDKSKKVAVGLSGGVDSAVAAAKLVKTGYQVVGFWMWLSGNRQSLPAAKVARFLKIPFYIIDLRKDFEREVIDYFLREYQAGRTPNPCIVCNQKIKFGQMLKTATTKLKVDYLATGHYAQIVKEKSGFFHLLAGIDKKKDQSYFLYTLDQKKLAKLVFPNGGFFKEETRKIANKWSLPARKAVESENICFIKNFKKDKSYKDNFRLFLSKNLKPKQGLVVDIKDNVLGSHLGLCFYTTGSRGGWQTGNWKLETGNWKSGDRPRLYVVKKDSKKNQLVVGSREQASKKEFKIEKVSWVGKGVIRQSNSQARCFVKVRSVGWFLKAELEALKNGKVKVILEKSELGIAPGQSAVFYQPYSDVVRNGNTRCCHEVIGGGVIR